MNHSPIILVALLSVCSTLPAAESTAASGQTTMSATHQTLLQQHCLACHGPESQEGQFRVDDLPLEISDVETAERWQKVLNQLNSGSMPPQEEPQPADEAKADFLADLANVMVAARHSLSDSKGRITMRRLNRREYRNTLRELFGVEINVSELPGDSNSGGFDTVGANLFISSNQIEQYQSLAREAILEAAQWQAAAGVVETLHYEAETTTPVVRDFIEYQIDARKRAKAWVQAVDEAAAKPENSELVAKLRKQFPNEKLFHREWEQIPGAPSPRSFGFDKGNENDADLANDSLGAGWLEYHQNYVAQPAVDQGAYLGVQTRHPSKLNVNYIPLLVPFKWPVGDYVVRVRAAATDDSPPDRRFLDFGIDARTARVLATYEITGTMDAPQVIEIPLTLTRGNAGRANRTLFFREKGSWDTNEEGGRKRREAVNRNGIGPELTLWVDWIEIERVPRPSDPLPAGIAALGLSLQPDAVAPEPAELRAALERFATEAFRGRTPQASYIDRLLDVYHARHESSDSPSEALHQTLSVILSSPMFLYLAEPSPDNQPRPLSGTELAVRLAYFLWSAPPDAELRKLGVSGELLKPQVLAAQTQRLLDDPRSEDFLHAFTHQWLGLDRLEFFAVNLAIYPRFDFGTQEAAKAEIYETVSYLMQHNASLRDLLKSDYVVINRVLANYYGIPGVQGNGFEKVPVPQSSPRGGLLGMAGIHFMGSNGERTSPVERGAWVLRKLLHDPPPPAPANIPAISRLADQVLTTRQRMIAHQEVPQCASCHRKIDPIGFGLENFDAAGQWRTEDSYQAMGANGRPDPNTKKTWTIDPAAAFHKGPEFNDYFELRDRIASQSDAFARGFSEALIEFALGRPIGFRDEPLVTQMVTQAGSHDDAIREFINALVASEEFRTK